MMNRFVVFALTTLPLCLIAPQVLAYGLGSAATIQHTHDCLHAAAKKHGHRPELVFGIAAQESSFNPAAVSYIRDKQGKQGKPIAYGVMQVYYDVHKPVLDRLGVARTDLFNPCVGAEQGARILREFMQVHGNSWKAVGAYYAGNRFQNEADRRWYANAVAKRVAWFERHGTASVLKANYSANGARNAKTDGSSLSPSAGNALPILRAATTMVAWEAN